VRRVLWIVCALCVWVAEAGAWGADGHRVIGEIAWLHLEPHTKEQVLDLLPQGRYHTLSEASVWADRFARGKKQYAWLNPMHYVDLDPDAKGVVLDSTNCPGGSCVVEAIPKFARVLEDSTATRDAKIEALRLLAHFVGDIHQPLHVAFPDTCGGCTIHVQTPLGKMTLHQLWDKGLLEEDLKRRYEQPTETAPTAEEFDSADTDTPRWRLLARELAVDPANIKTARDSTETLDPRAWARESLLLSQSPLFRLANGAPLPDSYLDQATPVMEARLRQAGCRLAAVLNAAFSGRRPFSKGNP
jgi:nuclease S1